MHTPKPRVTTKPSPSSTKKSQNTVVLPNGNRVGSKDIGTNMGTPKPKPIPKPTVTKMTPQDAAMYKILQKKYPSLYPKKK